jgi:hypothetical protein
MTRPLPHSYRSSARPNADVRPPAPGQAYFGYPQPARLGFPVPQQTASIFEAVPLERPSFERAPRRPVPRPIQVFRPPTGPNTRQPSHARLRPTRSRRWLHFVGYPLAVIVGVLVGVGVAVTSGSPGCAGSVITDSHAIGSQPTACNNWTRP